MWVRLLLLLGTLSCAGCSWGQVVEGVDRFNKWLGQDENANRALNVLTNPLNPANWIETVALLGGAFAAVFGGKTTAKVIVAKMNNKR